MMSRLSTPFTIATALKMAFSVSQAEEPNGQEQEFDNASEYLFPGERNCVHDVFHGTQNRGRAV
jgi:hypothetical protein